MTPASWREMVDRTRELEYALGDPAKCVAANEQSTVVVQRRCLRAAQDLPTGTVLQREMIDVLRPAPRDGIVPYELDKVIGARLRAAVPVGEAFTWNMLQL
jgi:N-acetylneuraminate synthase